MHPEWGMRVGFILKRFSWPVWLQQLMINKVVAEVCQVRFGISYTLLFTECSHGETHGWLQMLFWIILFLLYLVARYGLWNDSFQHQLTRQQLLKAGWLLCSLSFSYKEVHHCCHKVRNMAPIQLSVSARLHLILHRVEFWRKQTMWLPNEKKIQKLPPQMMETANVFI